MIERWCAYHTASVEDGKDRRGLDEIVADFAASEVRRALVAELERIEPMSIADEINYIDARLRELRGEEEQSEVAAGSRAPERAENAQADLPAPASSRYTVRRDEHGFAVSINRDGKAIINLVPGAWTNENGGVEEILAALNKPEPANENGSRTSPVLATGQAPALTDADVLERAAESDWIELMAMEYWQTDKKDARVCALAAFLRARLGPVEMDLREIEWHGNQVYSAIALRALSILRGEVKL
jgi:hypothetical protein